MTIIFSANSRRLAMMFNKETESLTDEEILLKFPTWCRKSDAYIDLQENTDLAVDRVVLSENDGVSKRAGDHLYKYLSKGYVCLGNYTGKPKPDMSHLGVLVVKRIPKVGFYLDIVNQQRRT